jgi:hypothetical protein
MDKIVRESDIELLATRISSWQSVFAAVGVRCSGAGTQFSRPELGSPAARGTWRVASTTRKHLKTKPLNEKRGVGDQATTGVARHGNTQANSFRDALSRLAGAYHATTLDHFVGLADEIERDLTLPRAVKVSIFLKLIFRISEIVDKLSQSAPKNAPELWANREDKSENAYQFVRRVYSEYLDRGLSKADIYSLDSKLYQSILDRERRHKDFSLSLRNKSMVTDDLLAELGDIVSPREIVDSLPKIFHRRLKLYRAVAARRYRHSKSTHP